MPGSVFVPFVETRDVFVDNQKSGTTNLPFDVEVGTHDIDLGLPRDYTPASRHVQVLAKHTPLNPLEVAFTKVTR
jgi:hypothetical protein